MANIMVLYVGCQQIQLYFDAFSFATTVKR